MMIKENSIALAIFTGTLTFALSAISSCYRDQVKTQQLITAIKSDASTTVNIMKDLNIIDNFIQVHKNPKKYKSLPWIDAPRRENYFTLYEKISGDIGSLPSELPKEIVKFYNYSKAARDAAQPLLNNKTMNENEIRSNARYVLVATKNAMNSARTILKYEQNFLLTKKINQEDTNILDTMLEKIDNELYN